MTVRGNIIANTAILPDVAGGANLGTTDLPFAQVMSRNYSLFDSNGNRIVRAYTGKTGTTSDIGLAYLLAGNNIASGTNGNSKGMLVLYGDGQYYAQINAVNGLTANRTISLPDANGTVALTTNPSNITIHRGVPSLNFTIPNTNAHAVLFKNTSSTVDYGTSLVDTSTDGKQVYLRLSGSEQNAQIVKKSSSSASDQFYNILDSGNYYNYVNASKNLTFIGINPITSTANDTTANWGSKGTGHAFYSTNGYLIGQPSQYGVLVNFVYANEVFQLFNQQAYGGLNYRSGNASGWDGSSQTINSWTKIYDTGNIQKGNWSITAGSTLATNYIYLQYE
jgi:hypothetical protein